VRVHTYVIVVDSGAAPNYDRPCTTLAVCKPRIRKRANVGDLVLAFAGKRVNGYESHTVVWAGVIAEKLTFAEYWDDPRFSSKKPRAGYDHPDNFYRPIDGGLLQVSNDVHGPEHFVRDTGGIHVLSFRPSWRFGAHGPQLPAAFGLRMTHGRRGERVMDLTDAEWHKLEAWFNNQATIDAPPPSSSRRCRPPSQPKSPARSRTPPC
jgi:hypothetical protein